MDFRADLQHLLEPRQPEVFVGRSNVFRAHDDRAAIELSKIAQSRIFVRFGQLQTLRSGGSLVRASTL